MADGYGWGGGGQKIPRCGIQCRGQPVDLNIGQTLAAVFQLVRLGTGGPNQVSQLVHGQAASFSDIAKLIAHDRM